MDRHGPQASHNHQPRGPRSGSPGDSSWACLGANRLQTNHADFGGTRRTSAARSPDGAARNGTRRTGRHEVTGLITQRSLVQIQPAQREKLQVAGLKGGSRAKGSRLDFFPTFAQVGGRGGLLPRQMGSTNHPSGGTRRTVPTFSGDTCKGRLVGVSWKRRRELAAAQPVDRRPKGVPHPLRGGGGGGPRPRRASDGRHLGCPRDHKRLRARPQAAIWENRSSGAQVGSSHPPVGSWFPASVGRCDRLQSVAKALRAGALYGHAKEQALWHQVHTRETSMQVARITVLER